MPSAARRRFPNNLESPTVSYFRARFHPRGVERVERQEHTQYDSDTMGSELMYYIPVMGLIGLVVMIGKALWVNKQDAGDANMQELAGYIARGASAFLRAEWKVLGVFAVVAAALLAWSGTLHPNSDWVIAIAFLIGAFFSAETAQMIFQIGRAHV